MKTQRSLTVALTLAGASLAAFVPGQVAAQDIQEAVPLAFQAMKEEKWERAQGILAKIIETYEPRAKQIYGGKFGVLFYNKGRCELKIAGKLKRAGGEANLTKATTYYEMAKESFGKSYDYPTDANGQNIYHKKSILYKGQAAQALEQYKEAIKLYKKFLAEREETDNYNPGTFTISMAICHFKLEKPDIKNGISHFETALKNKERWQTPDAAIVTAFQALTKAVIITKNEQALVDFMNQNRAAITLKPYQMVEFIPFFQKLATEALEAEMPYAAFNLFALIPGTKEALDDVSLIRSKLAAYNRPGIKDGFDIIYKDRLKDLATKLRSRDRSGDPPEVLALTALAYTHEQEGYVRGAFGAYEQLELYFKKSRKREDNLYNLVRTSSEIGEVMITEKYGQVFLKNFPTSKYVESVRSMMLSSLFANGEFEKCEEVAGQMIGGLEKGSKQHDICLHVLGGSKFYLGKFVEAHPLLVEHRELYKDSDFKIAARYFEASNLSRLQEWAKAAVKLDSFLKDYPDIGENNFLPFALYDRANVHFSESQYEEALVHLNRVESEFPGTNIEDMAYNLKGNILQSLEQRDAAKEYYEKALRLAETRDNDMVASEALYYLVGLLGAEKIGKQDNPNVQDALPYYDKFWSKYQDSPYKAQVAVAGMYALIAADRADEALSNLQGVISEMAMNESAAGLEEAIGSYTNFYLDAKKRAGVNRATASDELKDHFYKFPDINANNMRALAMLRIAIIGVYEESLKEAIKDKDDARISRNSAHIKTLFKELKSDFPIERLSNFVLVRVGDYLRVKSTAARQALPYYEERLKRPQVNGRTRAQFGIADIYGQSSNSEEQLAAIKTLRELIETNKDSKKICEEAQYRIVEVYNVRGDWTNLIKEAGVYNKSYRKNGSRVTYILAKAYDSNDDYQDAIRTYMNVYGGNTSNWELSVPAISRATELMWDHGESVDGQSKQQVAYNISARYIKNSKAAFDKFRLEMSDEVRDSWLELEKRVQTWERGKRVKTLQQLEEELKG